MVTCDPPPVIANGTFTPRKEIYDYRDVVQFSCQKEFTLNGSKTISCSDDGTFKPAPPKCSGKCFQFFFKPLLPNIITAVNNTRTYSGKGCF